MMPTRTGSTSTGPATAGQMSFSWKPSTSNGCRSSQPTKRLHAFGRPFRIDLPVKTPSLSTPNSHPSSGLRVTNKSDLASTITRFDTEWTRLQTRCSTVRATDTFTLPFAFQNVFESTEAKAAFLLNTFPSPMSNIKDNLVTKDNLTYDHCYQRLMDITTEMDDDKAYTARQINYTYSRRIK